MKNAILAITATALLSAPAVADGIKAQDAYARASGPMARAGAAFLTLDNQTDRDVRLIGAETSSARKTELHTHLMEDGVAKMRELEGGILIPAGEAHLFKRGADHIMMMGLTEKFEDGKTIEIKLMFEKADPVTIEVVVDNARKPKEGHSD